MGSCISRLSGSQIGRLAGLVPGEEGDDLGDLAVAQGPYRSDLALDPVTAADSPAVAPEGEDARPDRPDLLFVPAVLVEARQPGLGDLPDSVMPAVDVHVRP